MKLSVKQKQTHRHREQTHGGRGIGSLRLAAPNCYIKSGSATKSCYIALGTYSQYPAINPMENNMKKNVCVHMYMFTYIYVCIYMCMYAYICIHIYMDN